VALDSARFLHQLDKSDVPLLVDFWAPWCGPCRVMAPEFERAAARLEPQLRLVKVNIDEAPALAQRFGIASIPTVMLAVHGREIARQPGAVTAAQLERWVRTELARQPIPS
jgi:thioredoxin 2